MNFIKKNIPGIIYVVVLAGVFIGSSLYDYSISYVVKKIKDPAASQWVGGPTNKEYLIITMISLLVGIPLFIWVKKIFPNSLNSESGFSKTYILPLICVFIVFMCIIMSRNFINNSFGKQESIQITGSVWKKDFSKGSRKSKKYYLYIMETISGKMYQVRVPPGVYDNTFIPSEFNKEFKIGCLNIIYRKEF